MLNTRWSLLGLLGLILFCVTTAPLACVSKTPPQAGSPATPATELRVPTGFTAKAGTITEPYTKTGWAKEIVHEATGIELVFIPAGEFDMGSPREEKNRRDDEDPLHRVKITKAFYLGKYEVTQEEWKKITGNNPSIFRGSDQLPVDSISWDDCQEFCRKVGDGLRPPTEAEWEYACRAGTQTRFSFGDIDTALGDYAWYTGNSGSRTHPVGQKKSNPWGLYDMHGNVWEWCADWYGDYPGGAITDPAGPASSPHRVLRGGSCNNAPGENRAAARGRGAPDLRGGHGFRVAGPVNHGS
jgi:formylglycine-generating enzyme required for sulfatase activity